MKLKAILLSTLLLFPVSAVAQQRVYTESYCYENTEEYIPGYYNSYGRYVSGYVRTNRESVPCSDNGSYVTKSVPRCDRNETIFNGLLGGGIAAFLSKPDAYIWSVPLGLAMGVSSSRIGCK